jgi:hypothetical protein
VPLFLCCCCELASNEGEVISRNSTLSEIEVNRVSSVLCLLLIYTLPQCLHLVVVWLALTHVVGLVQGVSSLVSF